MSNSRKLLEAFGNPKEQKRFERIPNVAMFQPTSFEVVTPDKLKVFEELVADRLGIELELNSNVTYTVTCCPDCDDCD